MTTKKEVREVRGMLALFLFKGEDFSNSEWKRIIYTSSMDSLIQYLKSTLFGPDLTRFIERRIKNILSIVSEMDKLIEYLEKTIPGSETEKDIKKRMIDLINEIPDETKELPDWFIRIINGGACFSFSDSFPVFLRKKFVIKARAIHQNSIRRSLLD